jgi:hypothetical protein
MASGAKERGLLNRDFLKLKRRLNVLYLRNRLAASKYLLAFCQIYDVILGLTSGFSLPFCLTGSSSTELTIWSHKLRKKSL